MTRRSFASIIVAGFGLLLVLGGAYAQSSAFDMPIVKLENVPGGGQNMSLTLQALVLMTLLTVLPSLLLVTTSFTRIIITLSILRQALGTQQTPPNQVLVGLALFLTFFIMTPTFNQINDIAFVPYSQGQISVQEAGVRAAGQLKTFMLRQTRQSDVLAIAELRGDQAYDGMDNVPFAVAVPAFIISELRTAFTIGFLLFLPFLVIDIIVSSVLMALGMMMLSPMLISLPFKLMLFVLVNGWSLTVTSLVESFARVP